MNNETLGASRRLAMFPLGTVLLPGGILPLHIFESRYRKMLADCHETKEGFGAVLISRGSEVGGGDQRHSIGTETHIDQAQVLSDGRWILVVSGVRRILVEEWLPEDPYPQAMVRTMFEGINVPDDERLANAARTVSQALALLSELESGQSPPRLLTDDVAGKRDHLVWRLCDLAPLGALDRQRLLEIVDPSDRLLHLNELTMAVIEDLHRMLGQGADPSS